MGRPLRFIYVVELSSVNPHGYPHNWEENLKTKSARIRRIIIDLASAHFSHFWESPPKAIQHS